MQEETAQRYSTKEKAFIEIYGQSVAVTAKIKNLSATGAFLEWDKSNFPVNVGDLVKIRVDLRVVGKSHNVSAEVKWIKNDSMSALGVGVCFIKPGDVIEKLINRF